MSVSDEDLASGRVARTRAFFGPRAAGWDDRFPDDGPQFERAVAALGPPPRGVVLDAGCGTGRALPFLRAGVGPAGGVVGVDVTPEMLGEAQRRHAGAWSGLVLADVLRLPFVAGAFDAVFAAGLISHLPDPEAGLAELARVCRGGGRLAMFHPTGRAALARRQGYELTADDIRAEPNIRAALDRAGWDCTDVEDGEDRYLVLATRR